MATYVDKVKSRKREFSYRISEELKEKLEFVVKLTGVPKNAIIVKGIEWELDRLLYTYR